jgi:hypothetical protein
VNDAAEAAGYLARHGDLWFDVAPFIDYASPDGYYRKYRVMLIDSVPYPYHCAIDRAWLVHFWRAPMRTEAWMREEDARFVQSPQRVLTDYARRFDGIARALGLDYVGLDCAQTANGDLLVFEADIATWIHRDDEPLFAYRGEAFARIEAAVERLVT